VKPIKGVKNMTKDTPTGLKNTGKSLEFKLNRNYEISPYALPHNF